MKRRILLLLCLSSVMLGCSDMWTDRECKVVNDVYLFYSAGDGIRLGLKRGDGYSGILESTVSEVYLLHESLVVKADPVKQGADTLFYQINYIHINGFNRSDTGIVKTIEPSQFERLRNGHAEFLKQHNWK